MFRSLVVSYHLILAGRKMLLRFLIVLSYTTTLCFSEELSIYPIIMPMIVPATDEVYLCTSIDLSQTNKTFWVRGFEPKVNNPRIHHMALAGSNGMCFIFKLD